MSDKSFLENYFKSIKSLIDIDKYNEDLVKVKNILKLTHKKGKKTMIFGNGGSAAIASHFSVDLTKNAGVRCTNYNETDLITCFSNDFGYERWVEKTIEFYGDPGDVVILISSSGNSQNMLNGAMKAKELKFSNIITLTGNNIDNKLNKLGNINFWIDSKAYNLIENAHQALLLSIVDLIIGKSEYPPN